jgi:hypothetical protein
MNTERLLIHRISELIRSIRNTWLKEHPFTVPIATSSLINEKDTLSLGGNKSFFYFARSRINQKQKWGFYVRIYKWKSILWRL